MHFATLTKAQSGLMFAKPWTDATKTCAAPSPVRLHHQPVKNGQKNRLPNHRVVEVSDIRKGSLWWSE
jgi:hypothetical protein